MIWKRCDGAIVSFANFEMIGLKVDNVMLALGEY
jgi:hypothetical protein